MPANVLGVEYDEGNPFLKTIGEGKQDAYVVYETDKVLAFLDLYPACRGHTLLIPKERVATVLDLDGQRAAELFRHVPVLARAVAKATGCKGVNVLQNNGAAASQTVFHVHVHIIPRYGASLTEMLASRERLNPDQGSEVSAAIRLAIAEEVAEGSSKL
jgi:histidine triad (HIT) family protein